MRRTGSKFRFFGSGSGSGIFIIKVRSENNITKIGEQLIKITQRLFNIYFKEFKLNFSFFYCSNNKKITIIRQKKLLLKVSSDDWRYTELVMKKKSSCGSGWKLTGSGPRDNTGSGPSRNKHGIDPTLKKFRRQIWLSRKAGSGSYHQRKPRPGFEMIIRNRYFKKSKTKSRIIY